MPEARRSCRRKGGALLLSTVFLLSMWLRSTPSISWNPSTTQSASQACLSAARNFLGPAAQVAKCGDLTGTGELEVAAFVRLKELRTTADGIPLSKLVVLRQEKSRWVVELAADQKPPRNPVGYIGIDYIDDSRELGLYRVSFYDEGSHEIPGFTIDLFYLSPRGQNEGIPVEIAWNRSLARFQEYTPPRSQRFSALTVLLNVLQCQVCVPPKPSRLPYHPNSS